jgi:hypothetical protein
MGSGISSHGSLLPLLLPPPLAAGWIGGIWAAHTARYDGLSPVWKSLQSYTTLCHGETHAA